MAIKVAEAKAKTGRAADRRIVLWLGGAVLAAIVLFSMFGARQEDDDPSPTTYNAGSRGTKAAYLLLGELGYKAVRRESAGTPLRTLDAAKTTLVLTEPTLPLKDLKPLRDEIAAFLQRGGRVLATGANGASLLPGGATDATARLYTGLCFTKPEGTGALAGAGEVSMMAPVRWTAAGPQYRVEQRCGTDAVVVRYPYGKGEAIWWSSPTPLTNAELGKDEDLKLDLASVGGSGRTVLFDEYLHESHESLGDLLGGLPWWALAWQSVAVGALLVLSRGRRNGPLRDPVHVPRSSPIEFAESMGRLYERAGATSAAAEAARDRLLAFLREQCGLPVEVLRDSPAAIAEALRGRFGGTWSELEQHLMQAEEAKGERTAPKSVLKLVQALAADEQALREGMRAGRQGNGTLASGFGSEQMSSGKRGV